MTRRVRRVWFVVLLVALGAATNVAVAWVRVIWNTETQTSYLRVPEGRVYRGGTASAPLWVRITPEGDVPCPNPPSPIPLSSRFSGIDDPRLVAVHLEVTRVGWPLESFTSTSFLADDYALYSAGGLHLLYLPRWVHEFAFHRLGYESLAFITLPLTPLWTGLVVNTIAYAAGWWLLLMVVRRLYRDHLGYLRRRKGRCPRCAYDLRADFASGCPECGWRRGGARGAAA